MLQKPRVQIGVVGPCASGKTTLIAGLKARGYNARHIAQEHSYVQSMWQRITNPQILIFLEVSYAVSQQRRRMNWNEGEYEEQLRRLAHARQHADLVIDTNKLNSEQVLAEVLLFMASKPRGNFQNS